MIIISDCVIAAKLPVTTNAISTTGVIDAQKTVYTSTHNYCIARKFRGIKFSRKASHETFRDFIFEDEACNRDCAYLIT